MFAATTSAPSFASAFAFSLFTSRVSARAANSPLGIGQDGPNQPAALRARRSHHRDRLLGHGLTLLLANNSPPGPGGVPPGALVDLTCSISLIPS